MTTSPTAAPSTANNRALSPKQSLHVLLDAAHDCIAQAEHDLVAIHVWSDPGAVERLNDELILYRALAYHFALSSQTVPARNPAA